MMIDRFVLFIFINRPQTLQKLPSKIPTKTKYFLIIRVYIYIYKSMNASNSMHYPIIFNNKSNANSSSERIYSIYTFIQLPILPIHPNPSTNSSNSFNSHSIHLIIETKYIHLVNLIQWWWK